MSDGPTPPKGSAKVEQTQQTLAEKEVAAVEQESQSLSEKPVKEYESVVTSEQLPMGLEFPQNKKSAEDANDPGPPVAVSTIESPAQQESPVLDRSFFLHGREQYYDVDNGRGLVAIINNFTDEKKDKKRYRDGTADDENRIRRFFQNGEFGNKYEVQGQKNLDELEFLRFLNELAQSLVDSKVAYHSFFLFIMSHGNQNGVETYSENNKAVRSISISRITEEFKRSIPGKPKVIVIQACRGRGVNEGSEETKIAQPCEDGPNDVPPMRVTVPDSSDMLMVLSTVPGHVSYRDIDGTGSYLLFNLFQQLNKAHNVNYYSSHLIDVVTEVLRQVAVLGTIGKKQMPCFESTLRKKFYLLPPVLPPQKDGCISTD